MGVVLVRLLQQLASAICVALCAHDKAQFSGICHFLQFQLVARCRYLLCICRD